MPTLAPTRRQASRIGARLPVAVAAGETSRRAIDEHLAQDIERHIPRRLGLARLVIETLGLVPHRPPLRGRDARAEYVLEVTQARPQLTARQQRSRVSRLEHDGTLVRTFRLDPRVRRERQEHRRLRGSKRAHPDEDHALALDRDPQHPFRGSRALTVRESRTGRRSRARRRPQVVPTDRWSGVHDADISQRSTNAAIAAASSGCRASTSSSSAVIRRTVVAAVPVANKQRAV